MKTTIKKVIKEWVKDNYGETEAKLPSWDINKLAGEIEKQMFLIPKKLNIDNFLDNFFISVPIYYYLNNEDGTLKEGTIEIDEEGIMHEFEDKLEEVKNIINNF